MAQQRRAVVLVLGDLGRSPRMANHATSLAANGWAVDLVGYSGASLPAALRDDPRVRVHAVAAADAWPRSSPSPRGARYVWHAGRRALGLAVRLARLLLFGLDRPDVVFVQNPPGIPTLPLAWLAARARGAALLIDWHNLTSAMLALRLGRRHALVRLAALVERTCGRHADHNLFVSQAMASHLRDEWGVGGTVFRDRPPATFRAIDGPARAAARAELLATAGAGDDGWLIVMSPTSWTADEDFDLLLDAVRHIEARDVQSAPDRRRILVLATGRGDLRGRFEHAAQQLSSRRVRLATAWFEADRYPAMVAAADVGLCLHRSSSGLDLPMKVMDFFGSGVPVCALDYGSCLAEAVRDGVDSVTFADAAGLAGRLERLAGDAAHLESLRTGAVRAGAPRWDEAWARSVLPILSRG